MDLEITLFNLSAQQMVSTTVSVNPNNELDVDINALVQQACVVNPASCAAFADVDGSGVIDSYGIVKIEVLNPTPDLQLLGRLTNYRPNTDGTFSFAFARELHPASTGDTYAVSNTYDVQGLNRLVINWSEIIYLGTPGSNAPGTFTVNLYTQAGVLANTQTITLNPLEERDIQAGHEIIDPATGSVEIETAQPNSIIAQSMNYILDCNANGVQTAYVTLAREPGRRSQVGTGNSFLDMDNLLRAVSTTSSLTNTNLGLQTFVGEVSATSFPLLANGCHDVDISNDPTITFPANRYGILDTQTNNSSESIMDMLRKRSKTEAGLPKFDFIIPTLVR